MHRFTFALVAETVKGLQSDNCMIQAMQQLFFRFCVINSLFVCLFVCLFVLFVQVMVAEALDIARETYFAIVMDRTFGGPVLVGSPQGGMDIEEVAEKAPDAIFKVRYIQCIIMSTLNRLIKKNKCIYPIPNITRSCSHSLFFLFVFFIFFLNAVSLYVLSYFCCCGYIYRTMSFFILSFFEGAY
jgi:hypothetical protein